MHLGFPSGANTSQIRGWCRQCGVRVVVSRVQPLLPRKWLLWVCDSKQDIVTQLGYCDLRQKYPFDRQLSYMVHNVWVEGKEISLFPQLIIVTSAWQNGLLKTGWVRERTVAAKKIPQEAVDEPLFSKWWSTSKARWYPACLPSEPSLLVSTVMQSSLSCSSGGQWA